MQKVACFLYSDSVWTTCVSGRRKPHCWKSLGRIVQCGSKKLSWRCCKHIVLPSLIYPKIELSDSPKEPKLPGRSEFSNDLVPSSCFRKRDEAVLAVVDEVLKFQRERHRQKTKAGLERARKKGKRLGRARRSFDEELALSLLKEGHSIRVVARLVGVGPSIVCRLRQKRHRIRNLIESSKK